MALKDWKEKIKTTITKQKAARFLKKQGMYIVMVIGVVAVGITAFLTAGDGSPVQDAGDKQVAENDVQVQKIEAPTLDEEIAELEDIPQETQAPEETEEAEPPEETEVSKPLKAKPKVTLMMPVEGKIINAFSKEKVVYSKTLDQWSTHNGVDIAATTDSVVKAALSGTVEKAEEDRMYGGVIVVSHGDNQKTIYKGVVIGDGIAPGSKVDKGDVLGKVMESVLFEKEQGTHLHFEYMTGDTYNNPEDYFE